MLSSWAHDRGAGKPVASVVCSDIDSAEIFIADITLLNFNVAFEIGYAIGLRKRAIPIANSTLASDDELKKRVGVFDTLKRVEYENASELASKLRSVILEDALSIRFSSKLNAKAKVWVLQPPHYSEEISRIIAGVKKEFFFYKSFNPTEQPRMAPDETIDDVAAATGIVVPLLAPYVKEAEVHNLRAAFVAGLAYGMKKEVLLLRSAGDWSVPLDLRDRIRAYKHPGDIDDLISRFREEVENAFYSADDSEQAQGLLEKLSFGSPTAENEFQTLGSYFMKTAEFGRAIRGEVNLLVGRKGSGKTAAFSQIRNELRRDTRKVVVDLKPEGYQLIKLKDVVLRYLEAGSKDHLVTALWDYVLLLELAHKLLDKDREVNRRDPKLMRLYDELSAIYFSHGSTTEGDFSERLVQLSTYLVTTFDAKFGGQGTTRLSHDQVTQILYRGDLHRLRTAITAYLEEKEDVWILFDNIDKGWATDGVSTDDVVIVHALIEALWKIQRDLQRAHIDFHSIVFLRNDVYQYLVQSIPDRGKDLRVSLDWSDPGQLRELIRRRLIYNGWSLSVEFLRAWNDIAVETCHGRESSEVLIEHSLMRPRYLLAILNHCRGAAVNNGHSRIEQGDIEAGLRAYSNDLLVDTDNELRDLMPEAKDVLYQLVGEEPDILEPDLHEHFARAGVPAGQNERVTELLLWYGVIGIVGKGDWVGYIFDAAYDVKKMKILREKEGGQIPLYRVHPAFRSGLDVKGGGNGQLL
ncbi:MAG: hypothetical protein J0J01_31535 [Reyranella sp.]|uniref:P-loop ATPase, Sll1717 family n=1 Tax=Reyranella sp. TaxID=1929291 RepID=UPI001ACEE74C|nr:hypothetical protein [Reyranella sp.]MBN9091475.1 hypothetical protein [Reyranella sp.]